MTTPTPWHVHHVRRADGVEFYQVNATWEEQGVTRHDVIAVLYVDPLEPEKAKANAEKIARAVNNIDILVRSGDALSRLCYTDVMPTRKFDDALRAYRGALNLARAE